MSNKELSDLNKWELNDILDQQIIISQLGSGITFKDTDDMDTYERVYVIQKLIQMKKDENEAKRKAIEESHKK